MLLTSRQRKRQVLCCYTVLRPVATMSKVRASQQKIVKALHQSRMYCRLALSIRAVITLAPWNPTHRVRPERSDGALPGHLQYAIPRLELHHWLGTFSKADWKNLILA